MTALLQRFVKHLIKKKDDRMLSALRRAERFVLDEAASREVLDMFEADYHVLEKDLTVVGGLIEESEVSFSSLGVFAPFPLCWVEITQLPEDLEEEKVLADGSSVPWTGYLWEGDDGSDDPHTKGLLTIFTVLPRHVDRGFSFSLPVDLLDGVSAFFDKMLAHVTAHVKSLVDKAGPYYESLALGLKPADLLLAEARRAVKERVILSAAFGLMALTGSTHTVPVTFGKSERQWTAKGFYPFLSYKTIVLDMQAFREAKARTATAGVGHMPLHPVRAHLRTLKDGRKIKVKSHMRGDPAYGIVHHQYDVRG